MTTFLDLKTRVTETVIDLPPTVLARVPTLINEAIRSAQRKYNFRAMETDTVFTTSTSTNVLGSIANFKEYRDKGPYLSRQLQQAKRLATDLISDNNLAIFNSSLAPGEPRFIANTIDPSTGVYTFYQAPVADLLSDWSDGNYRIYIPSYTYSSKLVNDGDTNWFVENMDDYIFRQATGQAFALDWDYNSMAVWLQQADVYYQEAKKADKMNRLSSVDALVPMWQGANQPQVRE